MIIINKVINTIKGEKMKNVAGVREREREREL